MRRVLAIILVLFFVLLVAALVVLWRYRAIRDAEARVIAQGLWPDEELLKALRNSAFSGPEFLSEYSGKHKQMAYSMKDDLLVLARRARAEPGRVFVEPPPSKQQSVPTLVYLKFMPDGHRRAYTPLHPAVEIDSVTAANGRFEISLRMTPSLASELKRRSETLCVRLSAQDLIRFVDGKNEPPGQSVTELEVLQLIHLQYFEVEPEGVK